MSVEPKKMAKKYRSFIEDYDKFLGSLEENPFQGTSLGMGVYKTRMAVLSKGKGKSLVKEVKNQYED